MNETLRIKRRLVGLPGPPNTLLNGELAYNEVDDILYYGKGEGQQTVDGHPIARTIVPIAGAGFLQNEITLALDEYKRNSSYVHSQAIPSDNWVINHNLNIFPNIAVIDSAGTYIEGGIEYVNQNRVILTFVGGFSGTAYLS